AILVAGQNSEVIGYRTAHPDSAGDARAAIPLMKVQRAAPMPVDKWGIYKDTKNPELAVSYLLYLSSRENLGQFLEALKSIPPRRSMGNLEFMQHDAVMQAYLASLPYGQPLPRSPLTGKVNDAVGKAAGDFVYKNAPFSTVIETMITQIKAALAG
ncbi:MAG TPA: hypothetical protein VFK80_00740, partial [Limnochordia bacterium]|nr:hypothetical protein [Limnochordia bacterium]